jgi:glycosyltransferase involved in cell wall biosynthesis
MVSYFTNSNTFVLPSKSETFGVVYIEALLCGLPVIATSCGGPEDFVNDKNGLLIPVDNKEELINALKMIKKNDYDKKLISENCRQKFAPEIIANRITKLYEQVLLNENETN